MKISGSRERPSAMYLPTALDSFTLGHRAASPWVIPESRLLRHSLARRRASTNMAGRPGRVTKRLPLQTLETNTAYQRANPFENEVDEAPLFCGSRHRIDRQAQSFNPFRLRHPAVASLWRSLVLAGVP